MSELTPEQIEQRVEADVARISKIARDMLTRCYADTDDEDDLPESRSDSAKLDIFVIVGVWNWKDEDGQEYEDIVMGSESRKHHVRSGVLADAVLAQAEMRTEF